jgi:hypothetical protein
MSKRKHEPVTIDTTTTGNHAAGNYLTPTDDVSEIAPHISADSLVWIEKEDQAKQGMARQGDMRSARAAPDHPHIGHVEGSGQVQ